MVSVVQPARRIVVNSRRSARRRWLEPPGQPDSQGKSWPLPGNRCSEEAEQLCDFIWSVAQAAGLRRPVITGCSVGGNLTLMMGARHSADLRTIVPVQGADFTPSISRAALDPMDHPHVSLPHFNREQSTSLAGRAALPEAYDLMAWTAFQLSGKTLGADLKIYTAIDIRDRMADVRCPVLMIRGEDDGWSRKRWWTTR